MDVKVKTRGILIMIINCGVIVGYRELYGSESLTQVANLYLDLVDSIQSLLIILLSLKMTIYSHIICEQTNFTIGRHKHQLKHMNKERYHFFYIFYLINLIK